MRILALALAFAAAPLSAAEQRDPQAVAVAEEMMEALGGQDAWNNTRFIRFAFRVGQNGEWQVDRRHLWDKWDGRYRFEQPLPEGKRQIVLFNVNTREGQVYVDGQQLDAEAAKEPLDGAYRAFINDMYWLAMPWKWLDPGVNLAYLGERQRSGESFDVVQLSFGSVGLTPGDTYDAYVSKDSRLMTYWEYKLQSDRTGAWDWEYVETNGIKLAQTHTNEEGREINMGSPEAMTEVDEAYFTDPAMSIVPSAPASSEPQQQ